MIQNIHSKPDVQSNLNGRVPNAAASDQAIAIAEPQDRVTLSKEARNAQNDHGAGDSEEENLSNEEKQRVAALKRRDAEVKAHEQAHMAAGGGVVQGGAAYQYQRGPDGRTYAVGGEVQIDVSPENTPAATIAKMQQVQRAALAPAQPSGTDRAVAARAAQVETRARAEKTQSNAPSSNIAERAQTSAPGNSEPSGGAKSEMPDLPADYGPQRSQRPPSWKGTGRQINLQA